MNTYRRCKAKHDVKAGELVDMTTVEVFGKPVHVPGTNVLVFSSFSGGKTLLTLHQALERQRRHDSFVLLVRNLKELDHFVAAGIQPSNIRLPSELGDAGREFTITPDGIVKS